MNKALLSERLNFYKYQHALMMFEQAKQVSAFIKNERVIADHELHHSLWTSFVVMYAKPSKQRKEIRLDNGLVPKDLLHEHKEIITARDKIYALSDLDLVDGNTLETLNNIYVWHDGKHATVGYGRGLTRTKSATVTRGAD